MSNDYTSLLAQAVRPQPAPKPMVERAKRMVQDAVSHYDFAKARLKPEQSINLICIIANQEYDVYEAGWDNGYITVVSLAGNGDMFRVYAPVEQIVFILAIFQKQSDEPPREIGFHTLMKEKEETG